MMMSSGLAAYKFFSTENLYHADVQSVGGARASPAAVWNSRTTGLGEVLRGRRTPLVVRDVSRRDIADRREVFVHSVSSSSLVVTDGLTTDGGRSAGLVSTGRRYLVPLDHGGWFELLSQDGHAAAPVTSVHQLMKLAPERCLVRRTITAALSGDRQPCKIVAGDVLDLEGVVNSSSPTSSLQCLRCRVVSTGQTVLLPADQRGLFSPVAGPTSVTGVHRMRSVVSKFRLPVVVRLITRVSAFTPSPATPPPSFVFRVIAVHTEPVAYVVPLWLIKAPTDVSRRSLLSLPLVAQSSSVLDGVTGGATSSTENWAEADWTEMERRCDQLIKSRAVSLELVKLFASYSHVDADRQRAAAAQEQNAAPPPPPSTDSEWRLLHEIDHIYDAIKAPPAAQRNGFRTATAMMRQMPRRYRSVRQDTVGPALDVKLRSPARRSNTLDNKPSHYHSSFDLFHHHNQPQHPAQLQHPPGPRQTQPVRLQGRADRRQSSPQLQLQLQLQQQQLLHMDAEQRQPQQSEPVYEELTAAVVKGGSAALAADSEMQVENGQYVVLQGGTDSSTAAAADSLREIIKHNPAATPPSSSSSSTQPHRPMSVDRSRRWSVAAGPGGHITAQSLQIFNADLTNNHCVESVPTVPPARRPDTDTTTTTANIGPPVRQHFDPLATTVPPQYLPPRSVSSGRLTSSSSDDVTTATERNLTSGRGTVSNTLKRALCRHVNKKTTAQSAASENPPPPRLAATTNRNTTRPVADDVMMPVTPPTSDVMALEYAASGGGKVTHF